jgi:hypothetical protein
MKRYIAVISLIIIIAVTRLAYTQASEVKDDYDQEELTRLAKSLKAEFEQGPIGGTKGWKLVKDKKGIKIYIRPVNVTPIGSFMGEMEIKADLQRLVLFLNDDNYYPDWMYLVEKSVVLNKLNEREFFVYTENQPIWPCKVRDAYTFKWWGQDTETLVVTAKFIGAPDFGPRIKGFVRVLMLMGQYTITPKENGYIHIKYEACVDPDLSNWVPEWAVKWTLKWTSYLTLSKIRKMLPLDKYEGRTLGWLKVPGDK